MSSEFPPIIIDGGNLLGPDDGQTQSVEDVTSTSGRIPLRPSRVGLYLIQNNQIRHIGDYESEVLDLNWTTEPAVVSAADDPQSLIPTVTRQVTSIKVPDRTDPFLVRLDFDNFFLLMQNKRPR